MLFKVELHCGNAYRSLGAYGEACEHYERARAHLSSQHDMKSAGMLYRGLGYSIYELIQQDMAFVSSSHGPLAAEEIECSYQLAVSYLLQSSSVYQVSSDRKEEITACLLLVLVLLDFSAWRLRVSTGQVERRAGWLAANIASLLEDAMEQCLQVLMKWQEPLGGAGTAFAELDTHVYIALAYLLRVYVQRAALARLGGYADTAYRERMLAAYLCQETLNTFTGDAQPWTLVRDALSM